MIRKICKHKNISKHHSSFIAFIERERIRAPAVACSDFADKRDSQCLEQIVELTEENLKENGIELDELLADGGYSSGEALAYLHEKNINA